MTNLTVTLYNRRLSLAVILRADSQMSEVKIETSCWFRTLGQLKDDGVWNWNGIWEDGKRDSLQMLHIEPLVSAGPVLRV